LERGEFWPAAAYIVGSVVLSIGALVAGLYVIRAAT
jgi:fluoride ion exporter CrcB/FEX